MVIVKEDSIIFSDDDLARWYNFDPELMSEKLANSLKRDIAAGTKTKPTLHHFPTCLLRLHYQQLGYEVLLSEAGFDEYELYKHDECVFRYAKDKNKYQSYLSLHSDLRKAGLITGGGEPDLFVYKDKEAFFVEAKRIGPSTHKDVIHHNQKVIIGLINSLLGISTIVCAVVHSKVKDYKPQELSWKLELTSEGLLAIDA